MPRPLDPAPEARINAEPRDPRQYSDVAMPTWQGRSEDRPACPALPVLTPRPIQVKDDLDGPGGRDAVFLGSEASLLQFQAYDMFSRVFRHGPMPECGIVIAFRNIDGKTAIYWIPASRRLIFKVELIGREVSTDPNPDKIGVSLGEEAAGRPNVDPGLMTIPTAIDSPWPGQGQDHCGAAGRVRRWNVRRGSGPVGNASPCHSAL